MSIDLNCDMGEGYGRYHVGNDDGIMPYISSANIACGFHAGDPQVMRRTVQLAKLHGVAIGAHPGLPDLAGFGRREMELSADQLYADTVYQIGALNGFCLAENVRMSHVKPHGALYHMVNRDRELACALVEAVLAIDRELVIYTLPRGELLQAAQAANLRVAREFFADRAYQADGTLVARTHPQAMIKDAATAAARVANMLARKRVVTVTGEEIDMEAETVCIHGDERQAVLFARSIRTELERLGVVVSACGRT
ncbi:LamB/YcsF family protein [Brevibacillus fluminis]|uniref:LamB/YcsF family protein n=1 Tax=Brevibacillus fluminis TaxID=511487 RepID=UPI003F88C3A6